MKGLTYILAILSFIFGSPLVLSAQSPFIQHHTAYDGLPSNVVYYMYQDSDKFIWMATDAGVARFDGANYTYFRTKDGLNSNIVIRIKEDLQKRIWFFYLDGSVGYYQNNIIFNTANTPSLSQISGDDIICDFIEDENGSLYFYSFLDDTVFLLDSLSQVKSYNVGDQNSQQPTARGSYEKIIVKHLYKSPEKKYFVWDRTGLFMADKLADGFERLFEYRGIRNVFAVDERSVYLDVPGKGVYLISYDDETASFKLDSIPLETIGNSVNIASIFMDSNRTTWVLTFDKGVFCFQQGLLIRHFDIKECQAVLEDHEKNIWISSMNNGIYRISPLINSCLHLEFPGLKEPTVTSLAKHNQKGVWFTNGRHIALMQEKEVYLMDHYTDGPFINQMVHIDNNRLLLNELNSEAVLLTGLQHDVRNKVIRPAQTKRSSIISKRFLMSPGEDKIISYAGSNLYIHKPESLFSDHTHIRLGNRIQYAWYDAKGLLNINTKLNYTLRHDQLQTHNELARFHDKIISAHLTLNDSTGLFVIEGDSVYLMQKSRIINLTDLMSKGIDRSIKHMGHAGELLFLATSGNVYVVDSVTRATTGQSLHVSGLGITFRNIHDMLYENGNLYIASDDGLTLVPIADFSQLETKPPIPYFQSVEVNDSIWMTDSKEIRLRGSNKLKISFSSINYSGSPTIYSYMLSGRDTEWSTQTGNHVIFQDLPKGKHLFLLRATRADSEWSDAVMFDMDIRPDLWHHPLFYAAMVIIIAGLLYFLIVRRKYAEIKRKETEHQLILLEQKALQSMMNPHFIFNSLGSIQNYLLQNKAGDAGLYLSQFARLIRQNLSAIDSSFITLNEEIDRLRNYVQLEQLRFSKKFSFKISIDERIDEDEMKIPSMMLQPVVENAIWHGVSAIDLKGSIAITFSLCASNTMKIIIEDNGPGINQSVLSKPSGENHLNISMSLMKKRLDILGRKMHVETSIKVEPAMPDTELPGTKVTLIVPFTTET